MKKRSLTRDRVVDVAAELADEIGFASLTLALVAARLDIKPPSLYNHVEGLPELRRLLLLRGLQEGCACVGRAAMGQSGGEALRAMAYALRDWARQRPGLYAATVQAHLPADAELIAAGRAALEPFQRVLSACGVTGTHAIHALRTLRSAVHGFVSLESGGFGLPEDVDASFAWMVDTLSRAILEER